MPRFESHREPVITAGYDSAGPAWAKLESSRGPAWPPYAAVEDGGRRQLRRGAARSHTLAPSAVSDRTS